MPPVLTLSTAAALLKTRAALQLENIALCYQIGVLERSVKRPRLNSFDGVFVEVAHVSGAIGVQR